MASSPPRPRPRPRRPTAAASSTTSSSSVVALTAEDLLDTAASATVDSSTRWPEASATKSTLVVKPRHSIRYHISEHYTLLNAKDWVACDVPPESYNVICAYAAAFKAGMRLPLHDLHASVLRHYDLAPGQLMPNAWRYLNAFVLLCEDARVQPMLPVFLFFFVLCAEKESMGRYHFRPRRCCPLPLPPPDSDSGSGRGSSSRRLFTGKMPHSPWKHRFFFIWGPSWMPWPCSLRWGAPSKASVKEPVLPNDASEVAMAIHKLLHLAGKTGIDILKFLSERNPPVGHLMQIPAPATAHCVAVKQEPNAAAAAVAAPVWTTEQTRKRNSPEPITSLPPMSLQIGIGSGYDDRSTESTPAPSGVGLGHGEPRVTGGERSCFRKRLHYFAQEAMAEFDGMEQELQMAKVQHEADVAQHKQALVAAKAQHEADIVQLKQALGVANAKHEADVAQHKQALEAANTKHAADLALLKNEVRKTKQAEASRYAEELQKAVQDAYDKGVRDTKKYVVESLLSGSSPPRGPGLVPQAPVDDQ